MAFSRILVAVVIAAGLAAPATADAARRGHRVSAHTVTSPAKLPAPVKAAQAVGRRYWDATPCSGQMTIAAQRPLAAGTDPSTDAWVTFDSALGKNNLAAPAGSYRNCTISLAHWRWPNAASMTEDWDMLCTTMVHEMGHLLGRPHDLTRGSVMAPVFTDGSSVPSMCRSARPRSTR